MLSSGSDYAVILMDSPSDDGNILTKVAMDKFWELNNHVTLDIEVTTYMAFIKYLVLQ